MESWSSAVGEMTLACIFSLSSDKLVLRIYTLALRFLILLLREGSENAKILLLRNVIFNDFDNLSTK
jgi:hypothetical protein